MDRLRLAEEFAARPRDGVSAREAGRVLWGCSVVFLNWGQRRRAEEVWQQGQVLADRTSEPELALIGLGFREGWFAVVDGRLDAALEAAERTAALGVELGSAVLGRVLTEFVAYRALLHLGRAEEALQGIGQAQEMAGAEVESPLVIGRRATGLAQLGRGDEARAVLGAFLRNRRVQAEDDGRIPFPPLLLLLEAAVLLHDRQAASVLAQRLKAVAPLSLGDNNLTCPARHLGAAAALLGKPQEAAAYYQQALENCAKIGFRPETALTRLQLAELLLEVVKSPGPSTGSGRTVPDPVRGEPVEPRTETPAQGETVGPVHELALQGTGAASSLPKDAPPADVGAHGRAPLQSDALRAALRHEAMGHLDFAIAEFRAMKMRPSLEQALRHKELLRA